MKIQNSNFLSLEQLQDQYLNQTKNVSKPNQKGVSFQDILNQKMTTRTTDAELKFSKHASSRLTDRKIELTDNQLARLKEGTQKAGEKGINESLVIVDSLAFIVNIPNSTVITAMDQNETSGNIFTNIDGAVII